ncbi:SPOR domain-containing protein [Desulfomicrobium escambiense]|uniref:SPOR domain-containing protein n=1 Tax=Desulfomicrobium escambiense TaxID=29503 RepID=UPI00040146C9|nr:SPOR domain-containing protein [Desulfomicrobium escambiense]
MITRKSSTAKKGKDSKGFTFQLGLTGFMSLAVLVVIGMAWSFILGVIVGRGHQPEKMAMDMARQVLPEDFPLLTEKNEEVLKGEELEFFEKLKQGPSSVPPAPPAPPKAAAAPAPKPQNATTVATATAVAKPQSAIDAALQSAAQVAGQAAPQAATENTKGEVFVFNYQVAALASMEQAQTFLKKRDLSGFKTTVVQAEHEGKTWFRVYVHHQGTVESAVGLKEQLKAKGIDNILLRSRTPL